MHEQQYLSLLKRMRLLEFFTATMATARRLLSTNRKLWKPIRRVFSFFLVFINCKLINGVVLLRLLQSVTRGLLQKQNSKEPLISPSNLKGKK